MKAAVLTAIHGPLTLAEVRPCPPAYGQVLVRVRVSGICGAQLQEIAGQKGNAAHLPHLLGHEAGGHVVETGEGVSTVAMGDQVVMHWRKGDGLESSFPEYWFGERRIRSGRVVTFCEQAVVSENRVTRVPPGTPDEFCALLGCGLSTALATMESEADLKFGERVLIIGCGGLGVNLLLAAKLRGAAPVFACDPRCTKTGLALESGATHFFLSDDDGWRALPLRPEFPGAFDVVVDTSGDPKAIEEGLRLLSGTGRFIMVGQPREHEGVLIRGARHLFEGEGKRILATQGGRFNPAADIPRYVRMHQAGLLKTEALVTHRFQLDDINEGIQLVRDGHAGRVMIDMM